MASQAEQSPDRIVLVVDDEPGVRSFVVRLLSDAGLQALEAASGEDAVKTLENAHTAVALVVSDAAMPGISGPQLGAIVAERWPAVPFLLMSGRPPTDWTGPFLAKPFTPQQLVSTVEGMLPKSGAAPRLRVV